MPAPDEEEDIRDWCSGYILGVSMDDSWLDDPDGMGSTFPVAVLAGDIPLNAPDKQNVIGDEEGWFREARKNLGGVVMDIYEGLAAGRRAPSSVEAIQRPVRRGPKIGRNEPCPCGSEKKYKKCCLRAMN